MNHLDNVTKVYLKTGTYWENYATDSLTRGEQSVKDFVGWTGIASAQMEKITDANA